MLSSSHERSRELVDSILKYLDGMTRLAAFDNDRRAELHFRECWCCVWRAFYGGYSLPARIVEIPHTDSGCQVPTAKPRWHVQKYSAPTRKVVGRMKERVPASRGFPAFSVSYDLLECGHKVRGNENYDASTPARHRRCKQCAQAAKAKSETGSSTLRAAR